MSNDVNSSAMHSIAENAGASQSVAMPKMDDAIKAFEAGLAGETAAPVAVPTQHGRSTAPMVPDTIRVPGPQDKGGASLKGMKAPAIRLESEDAPNPLATVGPDTSSAAKSAAAALVGAQATEAATEVAAVEPATAEAAPAQVSSGEAAGWAAIKRAEAKLVAERQKFRAEQEQIQVQAKQLQELQQRLQQTQEATIDEVRKDPFAVLARAGWNQRSLLEYAEKVAAGEATPTPAAQAVPQPPPQQQQTLTHEQVAHMVAAHTADIQYKSDLRSELHKDEFKLLRANPAAEKAMYEFAVKYAAEKQVVLTPVEVARILQDEYRTLLRETLGHEVIRNELGYLAAPQQTQATTQVQQTPAVKHTPQTITNDAGSAPVAPPSWKDLPEHARIAALAKQLPKDLWSRS